MAVLTRDIWQWPEFKALMKRVGIEFPVRDLVISMPHDGVVMFNAEIVEQKRYCEESDHEST